ADLLAALRTAAGVFPTWRAEDFAALLVQPAVHAIVASTGDAPVGYALVSIVADQSELYDIAVVETARRSGHGAALLGAALAAAESAGAAAMHLEVAVDNRGAGALYAAFGFETVGRRRGYYAAAD